MCARCVGRAQLRLLLCEVLCRVTGMGMTGLCSRLLTAEWVGA